MSYEDANFQLGQIIRTMNALGQDYHGVLNSWDSQKGTFDGYVPGQFRLQGEQERRRAAGLDDAGNLLPGVSKVQHSPDQFTMGYASGMVTQPTITTGGPQQPRIAVPKSVSPSQSASPSQSGYSGIGMGDFLKDYGYG